MATGDAIQVGVAARLQNWRGENDFDINGVPDDWILGGNAEVAHLAGRGLSGLYATSITSAAGGDTIALRTEENAIPVPDGTGDITIKAKVGIYLKRHPAFAPFTSLTFNVRLLDSDLAEISANALAIGSSFFDTFWQSSGTSTFLSDAFTSATSYVELQMKRNTGGNVGLIDSPFLCWKADGTSGDGLKSLTSVPTGVRMDQVQSRSMSRDMNQNAYKYGGDGGRQLWRLELQFSFLSVADYAYLKQCYAVNTGKSGYRDAAGNQLAAQPIAVVPHLWDPPQSGTAGKAEQARPPVVIGKMENPEATFRGYLGRGYQGRLIVTEVPGD